MTKLEDSHERAFFLSVREPLPFSFAEKRRALSFIFETYQLTTTTRMSAMNNAWRVCETRKTEATQDLSIACYSFLVLLIVAVADVAFKI